MAEVYHNNIIDIDLESGTLFRSFLNHTIGSGDNNANWYGVRVFRKGEPIALSGCSVQGLFMPASGSAILISDVTHTLVSGNEAAVLLPQACYNVKGQFTLTIKIIGTNSYSITDTVRIIDGVVADTYSANPVAPTAAVPTYQEILAVYDQMVAAKDGSVRFDIDQTLTAAQMTQARGNIEAASAAEVSDLKSALSKNPYSIWSPGMIGSNGVENSNAGYAKTAFIPIKGIKSIRATIPLEIAVYSVDKTFMLLLEYNEDTDIELPFTDNFGYFRLWYNVTRTDDIGSAISIIYDEPDFPRCGNGFIKTDTGVISINKQYVSTDFIDIDEYDSYQWSGNDNLVIVYYNFSKELVGFKTGIQAGTYSFIPYYNAKYVRMWSSATNIADFKSNLGLTKDIATNYAVLSQGQNSNNNIQFSWYTDGHVAINNNTDNPSTGAHSVFISNQITLPVGKYVITDGIEEHDGACHVSVYSNATLASSDEVSIFELKETTNVRLVAWAAGGVRFSNVTLFPKINKISIAGHEGVRRSIESLYKITQIGNNVEIMIPDTLYTVVGFETNIYWETAIRCANINDYILEVIGNGTNLGNRWSYTPAEAETFSITINVRNKQYDVIASKSVSIVAVVKSTTAKTIKAIHIGDSLIDNDYHLTSLSGNMTGSGITYDILGSKGATRSEGRGGWTTGMYINQESGNAFYNPGTGTFDFAYYMEKKSYSAVDVVFIYLGTNDIKSINQFSGIAGAVNSAINNIKTIVNSIHSYNSNILIAINIPHIGAHEQYPYAMMYGNNSIRQYLHKYGMQLIISRLLEDFSGKENEKIYLVPTGISIDDANGYPTSEVPVSSRIDKTITVQSDCYHPSQEGYQQFADCEFCYIRNRFVN